MAEGQHHVAKLPLVHPKSVSSHLTSKRQRRPSVRLGEIGHPPAAVASDTYLKRKKQLYPRAQPRNGDNGPSSDGNAPSDLLYATAGRVAKTRPLVHVTDGSHDQNFLNFIQDRHHHDGLQDPMPSRGAQSAGNHFPMNPSSYVVSGGRKVPPSFRLSNKKSRNGKRRRGGPRGLAPVEKLAKAIPPIIEIDDNENEKASGLDDITDPFSDDHYDAGTPEGFRDCDLENSQAFGDAKERSNSQEAGPLEIKNNFPEYHLVNESRQADVGRINTPNQENKDNVREDREGSTNGHIRPMGGTIRVLPQSIHHGQVKSMLETRAMSVPEVKIRLMPESNGNLNDRLPHNDNADEQLEHSHLKMGPCGASLDGVKGWLLRLGLGKYAPVFEVHEVDIDVLPLLTLDDLREMGIDAVGTRRKMFCAIQKLEKCPISQSDSL